MKTRNILYVVALLGVITLLDSCVDMGPSQHNFDLRDSEKWGKVVEKDSYANFDLTINKSFYRNLALVLGFTIVGIIVISFFCRWFSYSLGMGPYMYNDLQTTAMFTTVVIWASLYIGAGCTLHPLRNKQGRITHMTMPATNPVKQ